MKLLVRLLIVLAVILIIPRMTTSCAQRGRPSGGPKDTIAPKFINSDPENYSINFNKKSVRIYFDEYVKLEEARKQILISPPLQTRPIFKPMGQASQYVDIEFMDSLLPNTTYTINFGQSIVDNNEGNPLPFFKYVFSTGSYIDSLSLTGKVTNAFSRETDPYISVMLYPLDSAQGDSTVYNNQPLYIAYTKDESNTFTLENMKAGSYKIVALKDENRNYLYNPSQDKIGFLTDTIHLPTNRTYNLTIFKEIPEFEAFEPEQKAKRHLLFGFVGGMDSVQIHLLTDRPAGFESAYYKRAETDSIDYWFTSDFKTDSLRFLIQKEAYQDTLLLVLDEEIEEDSLRISASPSSVLPLGGQFEISANTPLVAMDSSLIYILNKDSIKVPFQIDYQSLGNKIVFDFEIEEQERYAINLLPGAVTDFYGAVNDTLTFTLETRRKSDYAALTLTLLQIDRFPVIVQLTDENDKAIAEITHDKTDGNKFRFQFLPPGKYYVRIIYDDNANGIWDTGNYLKKKQPEEVIYMEKPLDVRANWDITQSFLIPK